MRTRMRTTSSFFDAIIQYQCKYNNKNVGKKNRLASEFWNRLICIFNGINSDTFAYKYDFDIIRRGSDRQIDSTKIIRLIRRLDRLYAIRKIRND